MFGIMKCFGGSSWGVINTLDDHGLALKSITALEKKGGMYRLVNMNDLKLPDNIPYINSYMGIEI